MSAVPKARCVRLGETRPALGGRLGVEAAASDFQKRYPAKLRLNAFDCRVHANTLVRFLTGIDPDPVASATAQAKRDTAAAEEDRVRLGVIRNAMMISASSAAVVVPQMHVVVTPSTATDEEGFFIPKRRKEAVAMAATTSSLAAQSSCNAPMILFSKAMAVEKDSNKTRSVEASGSEDARKNVMSTTEMEETTSKAKMYGKEYGKVTGTSKSEKAARRSR